MSVHRGSSSVGLVGILGIVVAGCSGDSGAAVDGAGSGGVLSSGGAEQSGAAGSASNAGGSAGTSAAGTSSDSGASGGGGSSVGPDANDTAPDDSGSDDSSSDDSGSDDSGSDDSGSDDATNGGDDDMVGDDTPVGDDDASADDGVFDDTVSDDDDGVTADDAEDDTSTGDDVDDGGEPFGPDIDGACTASQPASANASGSGPHDVVVETNSDPGINEGTIFRPSDLGGDELYPIFVWGEGGCSQNGLSNQSAMAEIASHGYFVVADGVPGGQSSRSMNSNDIPSMGEPLLAYVEWAIVENSKPCSAYYHSLNASKVAANGFSCGGLMSTGTAGDPRITTWGSTSSGTFSANQAFYSTVHTPVLIIEGGASDVGYENGLRDYENISQLGHPSMFFSKDLGHGGDLFQSGGGDFTKINLAWLNWWLKGDQGDTGKGVLVGAACSYCSDAAWEVMSENLP